MTFGPFLEKDSDHNYYKPNSMKKQDASQQDGHTQKTILARWTYTRFIVILDAGKLELATPFTHPCAATEPRNEASVFLEQNLQVRLWFPIIFFLRRQKGACVDLVDERDQRTREPRCYVTLCNQTYNL